MHHGNVRLTPASPIETLPGWTLSTILAIFSTEITDVLPMSSPTICQYSHHGTSLASDPSSLTPRITLDDRTPHELVNALVASEKRPSLR